MTLTIAQMEVRLERARARAALLEARIADRARRDMEAEEREALYQKRLQEERERIATEELLSFHDRLEATIQKLGANASHPAVAGRLHLIDLVRAGHKPGVGELTMKVDGNAVPIFISRIPPRSFTGSPGNMCASDVGAEGVDRYVRRRKA